MISGLIGQVYACDEATGMAAINVNGVIYDVKAGPLLINMIKDMDVAVADGTSKEPPQPPILVHHLVKDDGQTLFGFHNHENRALFRKLIKTKGLGLGPVTAYTITSHLPHEKIYQAIKDVDWKPFNSLPGIGPKVAKRLVAELSGKLLPVDAQTPPTHKFASSASEALINLGISPKEADQLIAKALEKEQQEQTIIFEEWTDLLKAALTFK